MKSAAVIIFCFMFFPVVYGQKAGWQNKDLKDDSVFGISTAKAYAKLLKGKKSKTVIVAIIDSGIDTTHEDLKQVLWINPKESPNENDDDKNGYIDDLHGWNFIGGKDSNVLHDNVELTRIIRRDKDFYDSLFYTSVPGIFQKKYQAYRKMKNEFDKKVMYVKIDMSAIEKFRETLDKICQKMNVNNPTRKDFENYKPIDKVEERVRSVTINLMKDELDFALYKKEQIDDLYEYYQEQLKYQLNLDYDPRSIVGDNYKNNEERYYGNNDVEGPDAEHGTHVAGIIGAVRNNNLGIDGIADNVQIMSIRVVPNGDERDKDIANAIRYAVDNGAKVINMSFGKSYSWDKMVVDDAVKYAMRKDVLLIHAAGNDGKNLNENENFPNKRYADSSGEAKAWIEVGASGWRNDSTLVATFSNYGKTTVDVFAPGVHIYSTVQGDKYENEDGTSMAAPVVSGLAALIREYYPKLTALQVKDIIMKSVTKVNHEVVIGESIDIKKVPFINICKSGGIVNAFNALKLAEYYK